MSALDDKLKLHSGGCGVSMGSPFCTCLSGKARGELDAIRSTVTALEAEVARLREAKDGAYRERNMLVCALTKVFPSWLARHPDTDTTWEDDWRWTVFVQLPTGQATWHIHDSEYASFDHLSVGVNQWDGHTNDEKYRRVTALAPAAQKDGDRG